MIKSKTFYIVSLDEFKEPSIEKIIIRGKDIKEGLEAFKEINQYDIFDNLDGAKYFLRRLIRKEQQRLDQIDFNLKFINETNVLSQEIDTRQFTNKKR